MQVLVTGGAGYIGSVVNQLLIKAGHDVVVYDNLSNGHAAAVLPGIPLVQADIIDGTALIAAIKHYKIQAVVHMAAHCLVGESMTEPGKYYRNNVVAGISLLECMRACGVERIVFSSTAAVYGEPLKQPIDESHPQAPLNPYGETKLAFENALRWYSEGYGLRYVSLRYFNASGASPEFGEWHHPETHLIPLVLQAALGKRAAVEIFGDDYPTRDGTCLRDYVHVWDLATAHVLALEALNAPDARNRIFNLGCEGEGYTVREVIDVARKVTGREIPAKICPRRPGDPAKLVASSSRIRKELGWNPKYQDLSDIIGSAWNWLLAHPEGYSD
jgi:UDP-glucose 4-epimerase